MTTGIVGALDPACLLQIDHYTYFHPERSILGPMTLKVEAEPLRDGRAVLRITQDGYQMGDDWGWYYKAVRQAWPQVGKDVAVPGAGLSLDAFLRTLAKPLDAHSLTRRYS